MAAQSYDYTNARVLAVKNNVDFDFIHCLQCTLVTVHGLHQKYKHPMYTFWRKISGFCTDSLFSLLKQCLI